jgi:hypothetical protein
VYLPGMLFRVLWLPCCVSMLTQHGSQGSVHSFGTNCNRRRTWKSVHLCTACTLCCTVLPSL